MRSNIIIHQEREALPCFRKFLRERKELAEGSRNSVLFRSACHLRRQGLGEEKVLRLIDQWNADLFNPLPTKEAHRCARQPFQGRGGQGYVGAGCEDPQWASRYCGPEERRECPLYKRQLARRVLTQVERKLAASPPFGGREGPTLTALLLAHVRKALERGEIEIIGDDGEWVHIESRYFLSLREAMLESGIRSLQTVAKATKALMERAIVNWGEMEVSLEVARRAKGQRATEYRMKIWAGGQKCNTNLPGRGVECYSFVLPQPKEDLFCRPRGLDRSGWMALALVAVRAGISEKEASLIWGVSERTARRRFERLSKVGLVVRRDGRWFLAPEARNLREVARELGVDGAGERLRRRIEGERREYRWRILWARLSMEQRRRVAEAELRRLLYRYMEEKIPPPEGEEGVGGFEAHEIIPL